MRWSSSTREFELVYLSAEHGVWLRPPDGPPVAIGQQLEIIPDYHDTTTFRHDAFVGLRDGVVERSSRSSPAAS